MKTASNFNAAPIIILGAPRSGTLLLARILGSSQQTFLITEHSSKPGHKARFCPEDTSNIDDSRLWRRHFEFESWDVERQRPLCEEPKYDRERIAQLRNLYLEAAGGRRLVIKNPLHLARVPILKEMFPGATFVFSLRDPWETLQSAIIRNSYSFIVPTTFVNGHAEDVFLRAAATWAESIDVFTRERDQNWVAVRHEDLLSKPEIVVKGLFETAGIADAAAFGRAASLPVRRPHDYSLIRYRLMTNVYRHQIRALIRERALRFGYADSPNHLPGSALKHAASLVWPSNKTRTRRGSKRGAGGPDASAVALSPASRRVTR